MLDRAEPILKFVCAALAALLLLQVVGVLRRLNPLRHSTIPEPPTWSPPAAPTPTNPPAGRPGPRATPAAMSPAGNPAPAVLAPGMLSPAMPAPGMPFPGRPGHGGPPGPALPPETQARLDRVIQSELLGPVMRPPPMALLGIAGQDVLFRGPNGQTGLVREGGELGGVHIVRIGTNRVLVREGTELKELTIFGGIGGESLMPKGKEATP